jgi:hypothetical protein
MKKKTLISATAAIIVCSLFAGAIADQYIKFSSKFVKHFRDCESYEETITSTFESKTFKTNRKIIGWRGGACRYEETITSPEDQYKLICNFPSIQLDALYSTMKDRSKKTEVDELEIFAPQATSNGGVKYVVLETQPIKGNRAYVAWTKIQNNPYFCQPQKIK